MISIVLALAACLFLVIFYLVSKEENAGYLVDRLGTSLGILIMIAFLGLMTFAAILTLIAWSGIFYYYIIMPLINLF